MKGGKSRSGSKVKSRFYIFLPAIIIIHHRIGLKCLNFNQNPQLNRQILTTKIHYSFEISKFRWNSVERSGANQSYSTRLARRSIGYTGWICWWLDKWFFRILCGGVISWTAIAGEGYSKSNPTRTVHPFHGWIFQFRGIFVARPIRADKRSRRFRWKLALPIGSPSPPPVARIIRGRGWKFRDPRRGRHG